MSLETYRQYSESVLTPDVLAQPPPAQFRPPLWQLSKAVLERALLDAGQQRPCTPTARQDRHVAATARAWIWSDDVDGPYSFLNVCERLGLEPTRLRRLVSGWTIGAA